MQAPVEYDRNRNGYIYTQAFSLPLAQVGQEEILAILLTRNLLSLGEGGYVSQCFQRLSNTLLLQTRALGLSRERIDQAFSAAWFGYAPTQSRTFRLVSSALLQHRAVSFTYTSPAANTISHRTVLPHHLQHYMGSWVLIAWCRTRQDWRKFYLSRMEDVHELSETFIPRPKQEWEYQVRGGFGIFQGQETFAVVLRFNAFRARWIREQVWHTEQTVRELDGGGLELTFPAADLREIKMRVLSFGADVEVIEPEDLRLEVAAEVRRMAGMYTSRVSEKGW